MSNDYSLFFEFIETFTPSGFKGIKPNHPLICEIEEMTKNNNQFFVVADAIEMRIVYSSSRSTQMIGIKPEEVTPYFFFEATHPDDIQRHNLGRSKLFKIAQEIFIAKKGSAVLSATLKIRNPMGEYSCLLIQCYLFYSSVPYNTVYILQLHTDVDWCMKIKNGFHYYVGNDLSYFRYPDKSLMNTGQIFSDREFQIIKLIESGLSTDEIADKLFLSRHTVSTHRSKILKKSGKNHISDLIYSLTEQGFL